MRDHADYLIMSTVNVCEAVQTLIKDGFDEDVSLGLVRRLPVEIVPADLAAAERAALLFKPTRKRGLSLGDRFCLALALQRSLPVLTGDRAWAELDIENLDVRLIR